MLKWILEMIFIRLSPGGRKFLSLVREEMFKEIYTYTVLSMRGDPKKWQGLIKEACKGSISPDVETCRKIAIEMGIKKYMTKIPNYTVVGDDGSLEKIFNSDDESKTSH